MFKILYKRLLRRLSSLPLAIGEMFVIAGLSAVGTVIEQNKPLQYYFDNYPDGPNKVRTFLNPPALTDHDLLVAAALLVECRFACLWQVLGFLTYDWIFTLQLDRIYTAPYFLALMALLAASLAACTSTR